MNKLRGVSYIRMMGECQLENIHIEIIVYNLIFEFVLFYFMNLLYEFINLFYEFVLFYFFLDFFLFNLTNIIHMNRFMCRQPGPVKGPCNEKVKRWYHNFQSGQCLEFEFGGCNGNYSNFASKADCELQCKGNHVRIDHLGTFEFAYQ